MSYLLLVWKGIWRKPLRTIFSLASIGVAFLLFGLLQGVNASFEAAVDKSGADRLYVRNHVSDFEGLSISALAQIEATPGVGDVAYQSLFPAYYQQPADSVVAFAVDPVRFFKTNKDLQVAPAALAAMASTRTGALVGSARAAREGWKLGERIPLHSSYWVHADGSREWTFEIVGFFSDKSEKINLLTNGLLINYAYFDEARAFGKGLVGVYLVNILDPKAATEVANAIDTRFANSSWPTKTETIKDGVASQLKQIGDIKFMVYAIVAAVFFTLLFVTWNTTMQSVRERIPEFAVLKTLGFPGSTVTGLVIAEVFLLYAAAALAGLGLAAVVLPALGAGLGIATFPASVLLGGVGIALALTALTGLLPYWHLKRVNLVDALSGR
ncbi:MAG: FtsX-like permease family protein [Pseudomonadota bacterium]